MLGHPYFSAGDFTKDLDEEQTEDFLNKKRVYESACRQVRVSPNSSFIRQLGSNIICLKNCELTAADVKAVCIVLLVSRTKFFFEFVSEAN